MLLSCVFWSVSDSVSVSSLYFPSFLSLLSGLDCFQEPHGVMLPALSACVSVYVHVFFLFYLCRLFSFLSIIANVICKVEMKQPPSSSEMFWTNVILCYSLFLSSPPQSPAKILAFVLFVLCNYVCVTSASGLHKCNYLLSIYRIYFIDIFHEF